MSDHKIKGIRPDIVVSEGKQQFLDTLAHAYDRFTSELGHEPAALVYSLCSAKGAANAGYVTTIDDSGLVAMMVARSVVVTNQSLLDWEKGHAHDCPNR